MEELSGTLKSRYRIESLIAHGGIGSTYLARDEARDKKVALKALDFQRMEDWKILELFEREVKTLKTVNHPLIPDYYDDFEMTAEGRKYFVLVQEYIEGENLQDIIASGKRFTLEEAVAIMRSLLETLRYLHGLKPPVIHRDINPKNIIIGPSRRPYLVDFGAVGLVKNTLAAARSDTFVGTIGYIAPEQLYGKASPASDLYSLGVTFLFLLTGLDPADFPRSGLRIDFSAHREIPYGLAEVVAKMIEPDEAERYARAGEVLDDLKDKRVLSVYDEETAEDDEAGGRLKPLSPPPRRLGPAGRLFLHRRLTGDSGLFGMPFAGLGLFFFFVFVIAGRTLPAFFVSAADHQAAGAIVAVESTNATENDVPVIKYVFEFHAADDRTYRQHSYTTGTRFHQGQSVAVRYLAANPRLAVIEGARYSTFDPFVLFTAIFPIVGFGMMFAGRPRRTARHSRLLCRGLTATGRIIRIPEGKTSSAWIEYEYKQGDSFVRGRHYTRNKYDYENGEVRRVLYGPGRKDDSIILEKDYVCRRGRWDFGRVTLKIFWKTIMPLFGFYALWGALGLTIAVIVLQFF